MPGTPQVELLPKAQDLRRLLGTSRIRNRVLHCGGANASSFTRHLAALAIRPSPLDCNWIEQFEKLRGQRTGSIWVLVIVSDAPVARALRGQCEEDVRLVTQWCNQRPMAALVDWQ